MSNCKDCLYHEVLSEVYDIHVDEQDCPEHGNCEEFKALKEEFEGNKNED